MRHERGRFIGDLNLLTGGRPVVAGRIEVDSTVVRLPPEQLRRMMGAETDLGDLVFAALMARRELLRSGEGAKTLRIVGSQYSARALDLRRFVRRQRLAHTWINLVLDGVGTGGQAGTSSRIENFFGFPAGVSGGELVERGALQASRLGAQIRVPCRVVGLAHAHEGYTLRLADGAEVTARAVVVALGVRYRRLPLERLERFAGAGVYYAATDLESRVCGANPVVVVGGGNSTGQAAIFLAQRGAPVTIAIRGDGLAASMSKYLIDRSDAAPNITVRPHTHVVALHGDGHLQQVTLRTAAPDGDTTDQMLPCAGMFSFIGAVPFTEWLALHVALDERGFVLTDRDMPAAARNDVTPLPFQTSQPIFAAGDVRRGSMKRVVAAVGEGASAIRSVHDHLARAGQPA